MNINSISNSIAKIIPAPVKRFFAILRRIGSVILNPGITNHGNRIKVAETICPPRPGNLD